MDRINNFLTLTIPVHYVCTMHTKTKMSNWIKHGFLK